MADRVKTDPQNSTLSSERPPVFGRVSYDNQTSYDMAWGVTVLACLLTLATWIFVGPASGLAVTVGCAAVCAATWLVRPTAFRVIVVALAFFVPVATVVAPQIMLNSRMAAEAEANRIAAEKPYTDAVVAAKADLKKQGFYVNKLSLNRDDMTRGDAELRYNLQRGTSYANVILIKKGDSWTVNCSTAVGPVDISANRYELGELLYIAGQCPAGFVPSAPATP